MTERQVTDLLVLAIIAGIVLFAVWQLLGATPTGTGRVLLRRVRDRLAFCICCVVGHKTRELDGGQWCLRCKRYIVRI